MNHYPFDDGVLAQLGALTGQKTIKAICGRRVTFDADAAHKPIDCEACRTALQRKLIDTRQMAVDCDTYAPDLKPQFIGEADRLFAILKRGVPAC